MLAVLTTHPIQYQVPVWKGLAARKKIPFKVFYMSDQGLEARFDPGFGKSLSWDIDLLGDLAYRSLYPFQGCTTVSTVGSLHHDDAVWVRIAFSMMTQMSLLSTGFLATLFPLTRAFAGSGPLMTGANYSYYLCGLGALAPLSLFSDPL